VVLASRLLTRTFALRLTLYSNSTLRTCRFGYGSPLPDAGSASAA
jgi:hypothetical protein